jgi:hypothetical protein
MTIASVPVTNMIAITTPCGVTIGSGSRMTGGSARRRLGFFHRPALVVRQSIPATAEVRGRLRCLVVGGLKFSRASLPVTFP